MILLASGAFAQNRGLEEITIKTSPQCNDCKGRIEEALAFEKGVKKSEVDVEKKIVTFTYKNGKTTPEKIRKAISRAGYDADDVAADTKAYGKLPACCQKPDDPDQEKD